jgi:hypothetical protein
MYPLLRGTCSTDIHHTPRRNRERRERMLVKIQEMLRRNGGNGVYIE